MSGSSNFLQWNPAGINQETDQQYAADAERSGGAPPGGLLPSSTFNKLAYQLSTFIAALAQMMAAKGYNLSDANLANLAGVLANLVTQVDLQAYAPIDTPHFTGAPDAPNPPDGDDSKRLATTHWVKGSMLQAATGYMKLPSGMIMQWINGPFQSADGSEPQDTQNWPLQWPNACLTVQITCQIASGSTNMDSWYQVISYNNVSITYQRQRGDGGAFNRQTRALILGIGF